MTHRVRCRNFIVHSSGRLFGDLGSFSRLRWRHLENRPILYDHHDRPRFVIGSAAGCLSLYPITTRSVGGLRRLRRGVMRPERQFAIAGIADAPEYELVPQKALPPKHQFEIVVAKYREDVSWTHCLEANVTIYSKAGGDSAYLELPNRGYEAGTYLHHIVLNYDRLADRTLFLQGDPFPHGLLSIDEYVEHDDAFAHAEELVYAFDWRPPWTTPGQEIDRRAMMEFLHLFGCELKGSHTRFPQGAQFAVTAEQMRTRSREFYANALHLTQAPALRLAGRTFDNHHIAILLEIFWRSIFQVD